MRRCLPALGGERGSGTVLTAITALGIGLSTLLAAWVIGWVTSVHRAHRVADLSALAGATATAQGRDGCDQARQVAARNAARLDRCTLRGEAPAFVLVVRVSVPLRPDIRLAGAPKRAQGEAAAGPGDQG